MVYPKCFGSNPGPQDIAEYDCGTCRHVEDCRLTGEARRSRLEPQERRKQLLDTALEVAESVGFENMTIGKVGRCAGCTQQLVSHYYGTREELRNAVMRAAVRRSVYRVIAQGLANGHPVALAAPRKLQKESLNTLIK